jgi:hypothetical protein
VVEQVLAHAGRIKMMEQLFYFLAERRWCFMEGVLVFLLEAIYPLKPHILGQHM